MIKIVKINEYRKYLIMLCFCITILSGTLKNKNIDKRNDNEKILEFIDS